MLQTATNPPVSPSDLHVPVLPSTPVRPVKGVEHKSKNISGHYQRSFCPFFFSNTQNRLRGKIMIWCKKKIRHIDSDWQTAASLTLSPTKPFSPFGPLSPFTPRDPQGPSRPGEPRGPTSPYQPQTSLSKSRQHSHSRHEEPKSTQKLKQIKA